MRVSHAQCVRLDSPEKCTIQRYDIQNTITIIAAIDCKLELAARDGYVEQL